MIEGMWYFVCLVAFFALLLQIVGELGELVKTTFCVGEIAEFFRGCLFGFEI